MTITSEGQIAVNEQEVTPETLRSTLEYKLAISGEKHVILRADKEALHGELLLVMRMAKELGAQSIAIATEPKQPQGISNGTSQGSTQPT